MAWYDSRSVGQNEVSQNAIFLEPVVEPTITPTPTPEPEKKYDEEIIIIEYNEEDLRLLSSIIWSEAGNQCAAGQQAVGIVVMNRCNDEIYFPNTIEEVIYAPGQFTPAYNGLLNYALNKYDEGTLPESCIEAAKYALDGNTTVKYVTEEYEINYFYFNGYLKNAKLRIQDHDFA